VSQQNNSSPDSESKSNNVKSDIPIVATPFEQMRDEIKPHSNLRLVSPEN